MDDKKTIQDRTRSPLLAQRLKFRNVQRKFGRGLLGLGRRAGLSEYTILITLAVAIGALAGLSNVLIRKSVALSRWLFFDQLGSILRLDSGSSYLLPLVPVSGAILLILVFKLFPGEPGGYGFPIFLERVNLRGAVIRGRIIASKLVTAAITIGSGGSAGWEGPVAQIGGAVGSSVGRTFRMSSERLKVLVACGSAGAIAANFNAPIAGVLFAEELILRGSFWPRSFNLIILSSGVATVISRAFFGDAHVINIPHYNMSPFSELPLYALMGIFIGLIAALYIRVFYFTRDMFDSFKVSRSSKLITGAALVGITAIFFPQILGDGYEHLNDVFGGNFGLTFLAFLIPIKILATSMTLGSGGSGGVFGPALFIGTVAGGAFGGAMNRIMPRVILYPGSYALVGMGALLAASTHAPLTAIFLLFEMSGSYQIILPIIFASITGLLVARKVIGESIDTYQLAKAGVHLQDGQESSIMNSLKVWEVMDREIETVRENLPLKQFLDRLTKSEKVNFPVVNAEGELIGIIGTQDVRLVLFEEDIRDLVVVHDIATEKVYIVTPDDSFRTALDLFNLKDVDELPVVDPADPKRLIGTLRRNRLLAHYRKKLLQTELERT